VTRKSATTPSFDRIKPATTKAAEPAPIVDARIDDVQGKRALFSGAQQPPAFGSLALECTKCSGRSIVSYVRLAKMMTTGFFLPVVTTRAWVTCPACGQHAWCDVNRN
jgi:hypothetical protein